MEHIQPADITSAKVQITADAESAKVQRKIYSTPVVQIFSYEELTQSSIHYNGDGSTSS